jgi:parallel beta-helix repeat protein
MEQLNRIKHRGNRFVAAILAILLVYTLLPVTGTMNVAHAAQVYEVGPGQAYLQISDVPFQSLKAGDIVRIHWRAEPYKEKILISTSGTEQAPITIQGVPGPQGQLPVLDGDGAVQSANMETDYAATSTRGLVIIALRPGDEWGYKPGHIVIENLDIKGAHQDNSFLDKATGRTERYRGNAAGIFVERGENITVRGSIVRDNSNGVFVASSEYATLSYNILIEGNHIYDNGNIGSDQQHNVYAESARIVYQYNVFGPWKKGAGGNLLKDRSSGTIIRYNTFHNGAHAMDLVEAEDSYRVLSQDPEYRETYVYGNTILNDERSGSIVHYGGDLLESTYRNGTLHFYNNTIVSINDQSQKWRTTLFQIMPGNKVDFRNNIVFTKSATTGATPTQLLLSGEDGELYIGKNWISSGYALTGDPAYFDGVAYGSENLVAIPNNNPGFVNLAGGDYHLQSSSRAINQADDLSQSVAPGLSIIPEELRVHNQHTTQLDPSLGERRPTGSTPLDIGAYEFGKAGDPIVQEPFNFLTKNIFVDPNAIPSSGDDNNDNDEESNDEESND